MHLVHWEKLGARNVSLIIPVHHFHCAWASLSMQDQDQFQGLGHFQTGELRCFHVCNSLQFAFWRRDMRNL